MLLPPINKYDKTVDAFMSLNTISAIILERHSSSALSITVFGSVREVLLDISETVIFSVRNLSFSFSDTPLTLVSSFRCASLIHSSNNSEIGKSTRGKNYEFI